MNTKNISIIYDKSNPASKKIVDQIYCNFCYDLSDITSINLGFEIHLYDIASKGSIIERIDSNDCCLCIIIITDLFFLKAAEIEGMAVNLQEQGINTLHISLCKNRNLFKDLNLLIVDPNEIEDNISRILCVVAQKLCGENLTIFLSYYRAEGDNVCRDFTNYMLDLPGFKEFIDIKQIEIGTEIQKEIESCIKDSVVLCIYTSKYSERFWGMTELLLAKENDVPIVIADCLDGVERRRNPNAGNVPAIRFDLPLTEKTVNNTVLLLAKEYLQKSIFSHAPDREEATLYLWRGPELADLVKATSQKFTSIIYPAPPICKCETDYYLRLFNVNLSLDNQVKLNTQNKRLSVA